MLSREYPFKELPEIFSEEQMRQLEAAFRNAKRYDEWSAKRNLLLFLCNYELALRPNECVNLRIMDINFVSKKVYVPPANKLHVGRTISISPGLLHEIKEFLCMKRPSNLHDRFSTYLFPSRENSHISRDRWNEIFRDILKETGIWMLPRRGYHGHYTIYTLRHTRATQMYLATHDTKVVSKMLGHKNTYCTDIYIHIAENNEHYFDYMREAMIVCNQFREIQTLKTPYINLPT